MLEKYKYSEYRGFFIHPNHIMCVFALSALDKLIKQKMYR